MARYGRNPTIFGFDLEHIGAGLAGAWGTKNLAALAAQPLAMLKAPIDRVRPGLGLAILEGIAAPVVGWAVGKLNRAYHSWAMFGGGLVAFNDGVNALLGSIDLIGGHPLVFAGREQSAVTSGKQSPVTGATGQAMLPGAASPGSGNAAWDPAYVVAPTTAAAKSEGYEL